VTESDQLYLEHVLDSIRQIKTYAADGQEAFQRDRKTQDAIIRNLEIIGEAAKNLSQAVRKSHPDIPWRAISGTRDRLIHGYFSVDLDTVWRTVERDLPRLEAAIGELLQAHDSRRNPR